MAGYGTEFAQLHGWVTTLSTLQTICIKGSFNNAVSSMTLNAFAQAIVKTTVGGGNLYNYQGSIRKQFPDYDPDDPGQTPGDKMIFADLTDIVSRVELEEAVLNLVYAVAIDAGQKPTDDALLVQLFTPTVWANLVNLIKTANLPAVLGNPTAVLTKLGKMYANNPANTVEALVIFLSSIQALPGAPK